MASPTHDQADRLIRTYLDPTKAWTPRKEGALRALLRESDEARQRYDQAVVTHRLLVGADPELPSGFERGRMMQALLPEAAASRARAPWAWALGALAGAALVALLVLRGPALLPDDGLQARGGAEPSAAAYLGLTGVDEGGGEYEVVASQGVRLKDYLRLSVRVKDPALRYLFVLSLQAGEPPIWIAPLPGEGQSLAVAAGPTRELPFEVAVSAHHTLGAARLVAIFTPAPLSLDEVEAALRAGDLGALPARDLAPRLRALLHLPPKAVVQPIAMRIIP